MNCNERRDLLLLAALDALDETEKAALKHQLEQECPPLTVVQAEVDGMLAQLAMGLPPLAPPATAKAAFLARLKAEPRPTPEHAPPSTALPQSASAQTAGPSIIRSSARTAPALRRRGLSVALMAASVLATVALLWYPFHLQVQRADDLAQQLSGRGQRIAQLEQQLGERSERLSELESAVRNDLTKLNAQIAELGTQMQQDKAALAQRDARLAETQRQIEDSKATVARALSEIAQLTGKLAEADQQSEATQQRLTVAESAASASATRLAELRGALAQAEATVALLRSPQTRVVSIAGTDKQPKATARILWDQQANVWQVFACNLTQAQAGKTYELWFITKSQQKIAAGTFDVDANGNGSLTVKVPPNIGPLALAAITDEPTGGVAAPTGSIQLAGQL